MCGVVGIVSSDPVCQGLYDALTVMQHRGQDAAGIVTWSDEDGLKSRKSNGLVRDVFRSRHMERMTGNVGIGHVRYPTAGGSKSSEAQPFYVNSPYGICLAHNGNLTNYDELAELLIREDRRHLSTNSDSEVLPNVLAHELQTRVDGHPTAENVFDAVEALHKRCRGGYAVVALIIGFGVVAFRDPNGIRPLVLGERELHGRKEFMVASESVALDVLQFSRMRDVAPGECVIINNDGSLQSRANSGDAKHTPCIFEYVYFARPDSILDDLSVYKARLRMGEQLAGKIVREFPEHDIDVVIPIPDTSRTSALQVAYHLGVKYREGFIKNRYIGRTFIMPGQEERMNSVRRKLNAIDLEFRNKNVLLVDDSIVRGTTSKQIIKLARPEVRIVATEPEGASMLAGKEWAPHKIQGWTPDLIPSVLDREVVDEIQTVTDDEAIQTAQALAIEEGIFCGISSGGTFAAALKVAARAEPGSAILAMLPDTGERYLSTPLFEGVKEGGDDELLENL